MEDKDFLKTLKQKRRSHLAEIEKLQNLVKSIDNLIAEYVEGPELFSRSSTDASVPCNGDTGGFEGLNLTEAILKVMESNRTFAWRGSEINKVLQRSGYHLRNLAQKVSARLIERGKVSNGQWVRLKEIGDYPRYMLREEYVKARAGF